MEQPTHTGLVRGIRRWDLVAVAINAIIGAGIFGLPSKTFALIGAYSLIAFLVCGLVVALFILCFAEVGSRFSDTGGPYLYAREAFGPVVGFEVGWLVWLARLTAFAANCNLLATYLGFFWPGASAGWGRVAVIVTVVVALTSVTLIGVRHTAIASNIFTVSKLIPILFFIAVGLFFLTPQNFSFDVQPGYGDFSTAVLLLIYAFTGFEMAAIPAGEIKDPRRDLPLAMLTAIGVVVVVYVLIQLVCIGTLPELAASERPLADASRRVIGTMGGALISAGAVISITGNLGIIMLGGSRVPFAMAEQGQLPRLLARTHARFHTPHMAILLTAAIMLALTLSGSFIAALTISTIARLVAYGVTCAALPMLRRKPDAPPAMFKAPAGLAVTVAALALTVWLLSNSTGKEARHAAIAAAIGLLICLAYWLKQRGKQTDKAADKAVDTAAIP
jgi:APA family basic amino acid/polyamine antiporter